MLFEAFAETDAENVDQLFVVDRITEFPKFIGDRLEALAVDTDGGVALHGVAELGVETIDTSIDIVLEELSEGRLESSGSSSVAKHQVEDLGGDVLVDPLNNSEIILTQRGS